MGKYLNDEQTQEFMGKLEQAGMSKDGELTPEAQQQAMEQGAEMAKADLQNGAVDAAQADPNQELLAQLGVKDVNELAERYRSATEETGKYKDMLSTLLAYQQALNTKEELTGGNPVDSVAETVRKEMGPVYEKLQQEARNKLVQEAWGKDAKNMPDIAELMPEISEFMKAHPDLAVQNDGLQRAYDSVRSGKYRSEEQMLNDDQFLQKAASNERVRQQVIKEYLSELARSGESLPASVGNGGDMPLTGRKKAPDSMEQAKAGLGKMLGMK